jgi:CelD/BcsL family acetyltransferase involved in cellulose biosynthesis
MAEVIEINTLEDLAPYRLAWSALLAQTSGATFFQTYDWLAAYWRHFGEGQRLRVLVITSCGEPIGIVPLCERTEASRLGEVRVLTYPLDHWATWYGPIGANAAAAMLMAMRHLRESSPNWDILELRWTNAAKSDRGRTQRAMQAVGFRPRRAEFQQASAIDLGGSWQEYWSSRSSKWRNNQQRTARRLAASGQVEIVRHRPASAAEGDGDVRLDLYDACVHIASNSWQGVQQGSTTLSSERVQAFLRDTHAAAARLGMLDMNLLSIDGRPAAFAYNYHYKGRVQGLRSGFDPAVSSDGAGSVLLLRAIEDSFARGDKHYDLGIDYHGYKCGFRTHIETSYRFTHYNTSLRGQGVRLSRWIKGHLAAGQVARGSNPLERERPTVSPSEAA